eukprot:819332-Prorocentrum_minimum.AAC.1
MVREAVRERLRRPMERVHAEVRGRRASHQHQLGLDHFLASVGVEKAGEHPRQVRVPCVGGVE